MTDVAQSARAASFATEATLQRAAAGAEGDAQSPTPNTLAIIPIDIASQPPLDARLRDVEQRKVCRAMEGARDVHVPCTDAMRTCIMCAQRSHLWMQHCRCRQQ